MIPKVPQKPGAVEVGQHFPPFVVKPTPPKKPKG